MAGRRTSSLVLAWLLGACGGDREGSEPPGRGPTSAPSDEVGVPAPVWCLSTGDDGRVLVAGCGDGTVLAWRLGEKTAAWTAQAHEDEVEAVAVSPDGTRVISCGAPVDRRIRLWDVGTGSPRGEWDARTGPYTIHAVSWLDDRTAAWLSRDGRLRWSGTDGGPDVGEAVTLPVAYALAVHRETRRVAVAGNAGGLHVYAWDGDRMERTGEVALPATGIFRALAWDPGGRRLAFAAQDGFGVWEVDPGRAAWSRRGEAQALAWAPGGDRLALARPGAATEIVGATEGEIVASLEEQPSRLLWLPDGRIAMALEGRLRVRGLEPGPAKSR